MVGSIGKCKSYVISGYKVKSIEVETVIQNGIPDFQVIGLGDSVVKEASRRVRTALINSGFKFPSRKIIVNLSPAELNKRGSHLDLPIALSLLKACGELGNLDISSYIFMGELGLDGKLKPLSKGLLLLNKAMEENSQNLNPIILPNLEEHFPLLYEERLFIMAHSLREVVDMIKTVGENYEQCRNYVNKVERENHNKFNGDEVRLPEEHLLGNKLLSEEIFEEALKFISLYGLEEAKRAITISLVGGHHMLMIGRPGIGKTTLARGYGNFLPNLSMDQAREVQNIYSYSNRLIDRQGVTLEPPKIFHSGYISKSALIGGGSGKVSMGLVTLAHGGLLFLDELDQIKGEALRALCDVLDYGQVRILRAKEEFIFPARFILICATTPCKCGYFGEERCSCSPKDIYDFSQRFSGSLMDRIDMHMKVNKIEEKDLRKETLGRKKLKEEYTRIISVINNGRLMQDERGALNRDLKAEALHKACSMDKETKDFALNMYSKMDLSYRGYEKVLRIARSIADIDEDKKVRIEHLAEAMQYRLN